MTAKTILAIVILSFALVVNVQGNRKSKCRKCNKIVDPGDFRGKDGCIYTTNDCAKKVSLEH